MARGPSACGPMYQRSRTPRVDPESEVLRDSVSSPDFLLTRFVASSVRGLNFFVSSEADSETYKKKYFNYLSFTTPRLIEVSCCSFFNLTSKSGNSKKVEISLEDEFWRYDDSRAGRLAAACQEDRQS